MLADDAALFRAGISRLLADAGFDVTDLIGLAYAPSRGFTLSRNMEVNYLGSAVPVA